jgi:hypothetical protein
MSISDPLKSFFNHLCLIRLMPAAAILMLLLTGNVTAQKEDKIKSILKPSDIKKIQLADESTAFAGKYVEEANQLYNDVSAISGRTDLDEKTKKQYIRKLERQAKHKIITASDLYAERNGIKYRLYKTYIEKFWQHFEGDENSLEDAKKIEEQSNDLYFKAITGRAEAYKMRGGYEMIQKLRQAIESENQAIDRQLTVLGLYYGIDLTEKPAVQDVSVTSVQPEIEESRETETTATEIRPEVQQTAELQPAGQTETPGVPPGAVAREPVKENTEVIPVETKPKTPENELPAAAVISESEQQQPSTASKNESQPLQTPSEVVYRIQVAASRTPFTKDKIEKLCARPYTMGTAEENGWYKYYIVAGNSYQEAKKILRECGVQNAFIVPYKNGRRITISEATQSNP